MKRPSAKRRPAARKRSRRVPNPATKRRTPRRNPDSDHSTNETVVEYAVLNLFKKMSVEKAARVTAEKLSGNRNLMIGGGIISIDPETLERAVWRRLVRVTLDGIPSLKKGKEDVALDSTAYHFRLNKKDQKTLRAMVEAAWGRALPGGV